MRLRHAAAICSALLLAAAAPAEKRNVVTAQMRGAGQVASGVNLPPPPPATGNEQHPVPGWGKPLPYPIVIADRHNNRLLEVTPTKRIVWEHPSPDLAYYRANDDAFFSPDGNSVAVNEADNYDIHIIDYAKRQIAWSYGVPDTKGRDDSHFNYPDDTHVLPDGNVVTADIRNCRIVFIDRKKAVVTQQWGTVGTCRHDPPRFLDLPNGDTPLGNGDILVTEIPGSWITRMTPAGKVVWAVQAPHISYASDAYLTMDGQVIVADYAKPGRVVIFDPATRKITWEYFFKSGERMLDHPSLAFELPTGDVILNDDLRNRVIVIDRKSKDIVWQYGVTDKKGHTPGLLFLPDGLDLDVYHDWRAALGVK